MNRTIAIQVKKKDRTSPVLQALADQLNPEPGQYNDTCVWFDQERATSGILDCLDEIESIDRLFNAWLLVTADSPLDGLVLAEGRSKLVPADWEDLEPLKAVLVTSGEGQNVFIGAEVNGMEFNEIA